MQPQEMNQDEISLKELILTLISQKRLIFWITFVTLVLTVLGSFYLAKTDKEAKIILSMNFAKVETGKNPDGSTFDPYQIVSPYVLASVIETLDLTGQISANDIRELITMEPIIPEDFTKQEEYSIKEEGKPLTYNATQYVMTVKTSRGSGIDEVLAKKIAHQVVNSYLDYFRKTYLTESTVTKQLLTMNIQDYDYSDMSMVLHQQMDYLLGYSSSLHKLDPDYISKRTGLGFKDIQEAMAIIDEVDLNRLDSLISAYKLTKNMDRLIIYYEYLIEQLEIQKNKYASESTVSKNMLNTIEDSSSTILATTEGNLLGTETNESYFNSLILKTAEVGTNASSIEKDIAFYKRELEELKAGTFVSTEQREKAKEEAEAIIARTVEDMGQWIEISDESSIELYDKTMTASIVSLAPATIISGTKPALNIAIGLVLGLMLGVFAALFRSYWNTDQKGGNGHEAE